MIAKCQSFKCNGKVINGKNGTEKKVHLSAVNCPDCGYTLMWHREKQRGPRKKRITKDMKEYIL